MAIIDFTLLFCLLVSCLVSLVFLVVYDWHRAYFLHAAQQTPSEIVTILITTILTTIQLY